mgnify:CR=1 FL=1
MAETPSGMLNAVGLQNVGVETFCKEVYHRIKDLDTNIIVNVSGSSIEEYCKTAAMIDELDNIPAIELLSISGKLSLRTVASAPVKDRLNI